MYWIQYILLRFSNTYNLFNTFLPKSTTFSKWSICMLHWLSATFCQNSTKIAYFITAISELQHWTTTSFAHFFTVHNRIHPSVNKLQKWCFNSATAQRKMMRNQQKKNAKLGWVRRLFGEECEIYFVYKSWMRPHISTPE